MGRIALHAPCHGACRVSYISRGPTPLITVNVQPKFSHVYAGHLFSGTHASIRANPGRTADTKTNQSHSMIEPPLTRHVAAPTYMQPPCLTYAPSNPLIPLPRVQARFIPICPAASHCANAARELSHRRTHHCRASPCTIRVLPRLTPSPPCRIRPGGGAKSLRREKH